MNIYTFLISRQINLLIRFILISSCFISTLNSNSQSVRYFEFKTNCGPGYWQDTSFIAAASNQTIIDSVLANINRPINERKFINGLIASGNGGYNHNANHWFLWHFIQDQWELTESSIEVCDGCPYSAVDMDTTYWFNSVGQFCPWTSKPIREINPISLSPEINKLKLNIYPNPTTDILNFNWNNNQTISITIYNTVGQAIMSSELTKTTNKINTSNLSKGIYLIEILIYETKLHRRIIVE